MSTVQSPSQTSSLAITGSTPPPILRQLGIIGMDALEPVVIAALATESPLLLIGPHGTAKSLLLCRLCEALGLEWRHYNTSLLNYDDLVGYPLPDEHGALRFVQTPASIWGAQAVFLDELSRCRPDMQNRLFSIVHEKRVQGMPIERLIYRWAAMNPPPISDASNAVGSQYIGSEALDPALADRFSFVVEVPTWRALSQADRLAVIRAADRPIAPETSRALRQRIDLARADIDHVALALGDAIQEYVHLISELVAPLGIVLSGRRVAMLFRNIVAVHAASASTHFPGGLGDSAWLALEHSLPQRAEGTTIDRRALLLAHTNAWNSLKLDRTDPRRMLVAEACPIRRAIRALAIDQLSPTDLSAYVADGLAECEIGGRHALALHVMHSPALARLHAAVAEQVADLYQVTAVGLSMKLQVDTSGTPALVWQQIVEARSALAPDTPDSTLIENLLVGLFALRQFSAPAQVAEAVRSWHTVRCACTGGANRAAA